MFNNTLFLSSLVCLIVVFFNPINVVLSANESIILDCGSNDGGTDSDGRKWESDAKYTSSESKMIKATDQDSSLPSAIPYMTARVFTNEGNYKLSVKKAQRYWLRFYFYDATYPDLNIATTYFSLAANGITLLNNFSAAITAQALKKPFFFKEYSLAPMDSDSLELTFKPSDKYHGSFAFINGIELIPIPDLFGKAPLVGAKDQNVEMQKSNTQTMYRLNVAGHYISPKDDSDGLMRTWYDDMPYIYGAAVGASIVIDDNDKIDYKKMPHYIAPPDVYMTARSMGPDANVNVDYNLTWIFYNIDANFTYLVRLHFCEFVMDSINQRVFNIYINNQSAQVYPDAADVIAWTKGKDVPTYRDYAIFIDDKPGDKEIRVAISPSPASKPQFYDSILNGLEIFKIEGGKNLAGPNPKIEVGPYKAGNSFSRFFQNEDNSTNMHVIGRAAGGAAAFGLVASLCFVVYRKKKRGAGSESNTASWLPISGSSQTSGSKSTASGNTAGSHISAMAQGLCRRFSLQEMKHATKNFNDDNVIGVGGFGKVYKGVLDDKMKVAIKRSNPSSDQGVNEFFTEIEMLSKLRHKHLVSLIGFCEEDNEMCLVYDYMALGTLREHLYNTEKKPTLSWKQRLEICIGAARGLHYLHTGAKYTIIHRDVKTTNILLDENWVAKVSDFGLSKTGPNMDKGYVSTVVKGSFGYLDPEYFRRQQLTEKSDVYSFGVVLFEVLCGRPALNPSLPKEQVSLADWALNCKRRGILEDIIDPELKGKITPECYNKFVDTAQKCLSENGYQRPSMGDVLWNLEFALQLQENPDAASTIDRSYGSQEAPISRESPSSDSEPEISERSEGSNAIFSQIVNQTGR
ncbi:receptor-like protein kinase ANXUR1 [Mangifera indica]|uniref:receptor-like protein kinase ANXUR1 n=1 Tax=Mangifera indica TaxID=29780 RepID=UPI001CFBA841|nr:receptor-like protein kinase ANXUR1 [Mangifera indica]